MDSARIAALLEPFLDRPLSEAQLEQISTYIDLLLRWNARVNLTAIRDPEEIVPRHFGESLFLARHLFPDCVERTLLSAPPTEAMQPAETTADVPTTQHQTQTTNYSPPRVLDLGSGAGFPAIPIKIWTPKIHLTLIESNHKKAAFLREVARALTLTNVDVLAERAEAIRQDPAFPRADVVTFRAVEKFDQILPLALSFLAPQSRLAILIGSAQLSKLQSLPLRTWQIVSIPQSQTRIAFVGEFVKVVI